MSKTIDAGSVTANDNTEETERNRERRLRCRARTMGFVLNKRRGFSTYYGPNYWLFDAYNGNPVLHDNGDPRNRSTLDDVEAHLDKVEKMENPRRHVSFESVLNCALQADVVSAQEGGAQ